MLSLGFAPALIHTLLYRTPELNPIENVWEYLRCNALSMTVWESYTAIVGACCDAWNSLMRDAKRIVSLTTRDWAQVET